MVEIESIAVDVVVGGHVPERDHHAIDFTKDLMTMSQVCVTTTSPGTSEVRAEGPSAPSASAASAVSAVSGSAPFATCTNQDSPRARSPCRHSRSAASILFTALESGESTAHSLPPRADGSDGKQAAACRVNTVLKCSHEFMRRRRRARSSDLVGDPRFRTDAPFFSGSDE